MTPAPTPPAPAPVVQLPSWTDTASVISYLTSLVGLVFAIITGVHPGYTEPAYVSALLPSVGAVIAGTAQIVNIITHRTSSTKVAIAAIQSGRVGLAYSSRGAKHALSIESSITA